MQRTTWFLALGLCILTLAANGFADTTNLVVNAGFETGDLTGWSLITSSPCDAVSVSADASPCGSVTLDPGPHSGNYAMYLGAIGSYAQLSQTFATDPGVSYSLSYWLANAGWQGNTLPNGFEVYWGGTQLFSQTNLSDFGYTQFNFTNLTASGTSTQLVFVARQDPGYFVLDDVTLTDPPRSVPEPSSLLMLGAGLIAVGGMLRHKI